METAAQLDFNDAVGGSMINRRLFVATLGLVFATFTGAQQIERPPDASEPAPAVNLTKQGVDAMDEGVEPIHCGNVAPDIPAPQPVQAIDIRCRQADAITAPTIVAGQ